MAYSNDDPDLSKKMLDRQKILDMLGDLGAKLKAQGLEGNVNVVGGAAIALTLKDRRVTQDVDALVLDHHEEFRAAAREVAEEHGVDPGWISDDISDFVSREPAGEQTELVMDGINVYVASPEHLLAMKVRAATTRIAGQDADDLVFLAEHLGLERPEEIAELTARQFQGLYRDNVGYDEYVSTVKDAFMVTDLQRGDDPMERIERLEREAQQSQQEQDRQSSQALKPSERAHEFAFDDDYGQHDGFDDYGRH